MMKLNIGISITIAAIFMVPLIGVLGCEDPNKSTTKGIDQCMRREIFESCLAKIPNGPNSVVNNDWAEVVDECESAAEKQSIRLARLIREECFYDNR